MSNLCSNVYSAADGYVTSWTINKVTSGAMGGNFVKQYVGGILLYRYGIIWQEDSESSGLNGFVPYYTEPSFVHVDNLWIYDNGLNWMLQQIRYG